MSARTVQDRRQLFAHFLGLPIIAFRLIIDIQAAIHHWNAPERLDFFA
jgi:hypothetical protein